jgi:hypothetical protein
VSDDQAAAALDEICARLTTDARLIGQLTAAVNVALSQHRKSTRPAYGMGSGDVHGKHYCAGLCNASINQDTLWEAWPCFPYLAILAALTGTTVVDITAREFARHQQECPACNPATKRPGVADCQHGRDLAARWRRALREAGQQT